MLKLIDAKEVMDHVTPEHAEAYLAYFVQQDVWDFHVYRVMQGDYEGNEAVFTVEHEKISKHDVIGHMGLVTGDIDIRQVFDYVDALDAIKAVVRVDVEKGFENWDFQVEDTFEEAISLITENDFYTPEKMLYEDTEKKESNTDALHYHYSLEESKDFVETLLQDPRATRYEGVELRAYQNGREQGYALVYADKETQALKAITFGQYRSSDSFTIYHGTLTDTSIAGDAYQQSKSFYYRHFNAVKQYIFELLDAHAPLSEKENPIAIHPGLQTATIIVDMLFADKRQSAVKATIEGLQAGAVNGYNFVFYDAQWNGHAIGITGSEEGDVVLYIGRNEFQGLDKKCVVETYSADAMHRVVDRIFRYIEEKMKKTA